MRVPDQTIKTVGFVAARAQSDLAGTNYDLEGTGFFVSVPCVIPGYTFSYFVTAKHVIEGLKNQAIDIIVNKKNSEGVAVVKNIDGNWFPHPTDDSVDIAVAAVAQEGLDVLHVPISLFITPDAFSSGKVGLGDDVFSPGLFTFAPGIKQNVPIVRHGNIAMIPDGPIQVDSKFADVYLIEARSIGGLSGSPVFVYETISLQITKENGQPARVYSLGGYYLLGLVHGHWDIDPADLNKYHVVHNRQQGVNMGIAVVVPASKILETLQHPYFVAQRSDVEKRYLDAIKTRQ